MAEEQSVEQAFYEQGYHDGLDDAAKLLEKAAEHAQVNTAEILLKLAKGVRSCAR